jgi:hypothetical protein
MLAGLLGDVTDMQGKNACFMLLIATSFMKPPRNAKSVTCNLRPKTWNLTLETWNFALDDQNICAILSATHNYRSAASLFMTMRAADL